MLRSDFSSENKMKMKKKKELRSYLQLLIESFY